MGRNSTAPALLVGDIFFSRSESFFGRAIRAFGSIASGQCDVNHVGGVTTGGAFAEAVITEAVGKTVVRPFAKHYENEPIRIYRHRHWSYGDRIGVAMQWQSADGGAYGWSKMPLFVADSIGGWIKRNVFRQKDDFYFFTAKLGLLNFRVCSNLIAWGVEKATGKQAFGRPWRSATPDSIADYVRSHPYDWECIWDSISPLPVVFASDEALKETERMLAMADMEWAGGRP